jgi:molybdopterin/thiamine biosynthesis adenylyltransferase
MGEIDSALNELYKPLFFRLTIAAEKRSFEDLINSDSTIQVHDSIEGQLTELIKCINPSRRIAPDEYPALIEKHLNNRNIHEYGVWIYFPWSKKVLHVLDEEEFIEVRTNRNRYKITRQEQELLRTKKIGIVGLSIGHSIALTIATERICGELRIADFDTAELSNLNRIRTGIQNLGLKKTVIAAREISELDPFLKVKIFSDGLHKDNMDEFFTGDSRIDLFIEVCDGLDIKIESRFKARELKIPVVMDTNDRGMLDVERFDLEPERPVLHGLVGDINPEDLGSLTNEEKIPIVLQMASAKNVSIRGKASMVEVGQSISTWPQIASSVVLGGAVTTDVSRRLLLGQFKSSGRYYVDIDSIISDDKTDKKDISQENPYRPLTRDDMSKIIAKAVLQDNGSASSEKLSEQQLSEIMNAGIASPSTGNDQPWKWYYHDKILYLFHDKYRSFSFGDYKNTASHLTFGAVYENIVLAAHQLSLEVNVKTYPLGYSESLVFSFAFTKDAVGDSELHQYDDLAKYIGARCTNRNLAPYREIADDVLSELKEVTESVKGAELLLLTDSDKIIEIGKIIGACDKIRLLHKKGHNDFVNREMRWDAEAAETTKDGIDVHTLGLNSSQLSALEVIKEYEVIDFIKKIKGGKVLEAAAVKSIAAASALGLVIMPDSGIENYIDGGRAFERLWLATEKYNLALHPVISPLYLFSRINGGEESELSADEIEELKALRENFMQIFALKEKSAQIFLFKLSYAERPVVKSLRIPVKEVLFRDM